MIKKRKSISKYESMTLDELEQLSKDILSACKQKKNEAKEQKLKAEAEQKIQLGEILINLGLDKIAKETLFGALLSLDIKDEINIEKWNIIGNKELIEKEKSNELSRKEENL